MPSHLPDYVSSLSKYHTLEGHYGILAQIHHDIPEAELRRQTDNSDLFVTAKQRYLTIRNGMVIRDRLIDLILEEGSLTERVRMIMYFLFLFRDSRYRDFICNEVGAKNGKWDTTVFEATHTSYFAEAGGHKAFTNLRRFLFHVGVLKEKPLAVHFPPLQTWFPAAVEIAASSISDESVRRDFLRNPLAFLVRHNLNALVNATPRELAQLDLGSAEEPDDLLPTMDMPKSGEADVSDFHDWNRKPPAHDKKKDPASYKNDPAALERANTQHYRLEKAIASLCKELGAKVQTNRNVDLLADFDKASILFEMKSCTPWSVRGQIRRAISQVLEYGYAYRKRLKDRVQSCIVVERRPRGRSEWLIGYLTHLKIGLIWKNDHNDKMNCSDFTKSTLGALIPKLRGSDFVPE